MKPIISFFLLVLCAYHGLAQSRSEGELFTARPAPNGIWVTLTANLPAGQENVLLLRSIPGQPPTEVVQFETPRDVQTFMARFQQAGKHLPFLNPIADSMMGGIYRRWERSRNLDSMGMWREDLRVLSGLGRAYFDETAQRNTRYTYTLQPTGRREQVSPLVYYPGSQEGIGRLTPLRIQPTKQGVYLEFKVVERGTLQGCAIYRSYHLRTNPERIAPLIGYTEQDGIMVASFTDLTALPRVAYEYYAVPFDAVGNEGKASDPATLFHAPAHTIPPSVRHLTATSDDARKAIRLSWLRPSTPDAVSVEIYKSDTYTGVYKKIGSVPPADTFFYDEEVSPITTQYYTAAIQGTYERSVNCPRVPGILGAVNKNFIAPQNVTAVLKGRTVTLTWERAERDTKGYYIYRGTGYRGELRKIRDRIADDTSKMITVTDTLPPTLVPTIWTYAITDENSSYRESGLSERASVQSIPTAADRPLAVPRPRVLPAENGDLQLIWASLSEGDNLVNGYTVYRTVTDATGKVTAPEALTTVPIQRTLFIDAAARTEGFTYSYDVRAVSVDGSESSGSGTASYTVPVVAPLQVCNIQALPGSKAVSLHWNAPLGTDAVAVHIYRARTGEKPEKVKSLDMNADNYEDSGLKSGQVYHYFFVTEGAGDKFSAPTVPVSVALE
jgi:hypothetical protein